jgi:hypothetical protein
MTANQEYHHWDAHESEGSGFGHWPGNANVVNIDWNGSRAQAPSAVHNQKQLEIGGLTGWQAWLKRSIVKRHGVLASQQVGAIEKRVVVERLVTGGPVKDSPNLKIAISAGRQVLR